MKPVADEHNSFRILLFLSMRTWEKGGKKEHSVMMNLLESHAQRIQENY